MIAGKSATGRKVDPPAASRRGLTLRGRDGHIDVQAVDGEGVGDAIGRNGRDHLTVHGRGPSDGSLYVGVSWIHHVRAVVVVRDREQDIHSGRNREIGRQVLVQSGVRIEGGGQIDMDRTGDLWTGVPVSNDRADDDSNKIVMFCNQMAFAYTGQALLEGKSTDEWLARELAGLPFEGAPGGGAH